MRFGTLTIDTKCIHIDPLRKNGDLILIILPLRANFSSFEAIGSKHFKRLERCTRFYIIPGAICVIYFPRPRTKRCFETSSYVCYLGFHRGQAPYLFHSHHTFITETQIVSQSVIFVCRFATISLISDCCNHRKQVSIS